MAQRSQAALLGALLAATAAAYLPAIDGPLLFDDELTLQDPLLRAPFEHGLDRWAVASRPLTLLTFALNHRATGADTRGWHLTSLALHLVVVVLAWRLARRLLARAGLGEPERPALAVAALFALHPLQTEAVAYLFQRAEVLAAGLYLSAFLLLLAWDEEPSPRRRLGLALGAALLQALGALAKPTVATLPAAWLLCAALLPAAREAGSPLRGRLARRLGAALPLLALSLGSALRELALAGGSRQVGLGVPGLPPGLYLATELRVIPVYLRLALWPAGQCADWPFPPSQGWLEWPVLAGGLLLLALVAGTLALALRARGRSSDGAAAARAGAFGLLFFLVALAPSSSIVPLADPLAEHRVYLGLLGLALAVVAASAWGSRRLAGGAALRAGALAALALLLLLGLATARRAAVWSSLLALWSDAAAHEPPRARALLNLGTAQLTLGRGEAALVSYRRAGELVADGSARPLEPLQGIVDVLSGARRFDEARGELEAAIAREPGQAAAHALLAQVEYRAGRLGPCELAALRALALDPGQHHGLKYLGLVRAAQGDLRLARALYLRSLDAEPRDATVQLQLGRVEERLGDRAAACLAYRRATGEPGFEEVAARAEEARRALGCQDR